MNMSIINLCGQWLLKAFLWLVLLPPCLLLDLAALACQAAGLGRRTQIAVYCVASMFIAVALIGFLGWSTTQISEQTCSVIVSLPCLVFMCLIELYRSVIHLLCSFHYVLHLMAYISSMLRVHVVFTLIIVLLIAAFVA